MQDKPSGILSSVFGYSDFRPGQKDIIDNVLAGRDVMAVMMTSGGKSLCYQVPALCMPGTAVVISPLISLMKDQVEALQGKGVVAEKLDSSMTLDESLRVTRALYAGNLKLIYMSPEKLATDQMRHILSSIQLSFVAIDEAHCVSTWGDNFRPEYAKISSNLVSIEQARRCRIPRIALTATATAEMRSDIAAKLNLHNEVTLEYSANRKNLSLNFLTSSDKDRDLLKLLTHNTGKPTIIYTATVKQANRVHELLDTHNFKAGCYHGRLAAEEKASSQEAFASRETDIMVATNAFGMGIDRSDVRLVIHYQMPGSIENYYQEVGRAGRDGLPARGILLHNADDIKLQRFFIDSGHPSSEAVIATRHLLNGVCDDTVATFTTTELSNYCPTNINPEQVLSALRALQREKVLSIVSYQAETKSVSVSLNDHGQELDFSRLDQQRILLEKKLANMANLCESNLCRNRQVMRYFGLTEPHFGCGLCDNCIRYALIKANCLGDFSYSQANKALELMRSPVNEGLLIKHLLGVQQDQSIEAFGEKAFGCCEQFSETGILRCIAALVENGFLVRQQDNVCLTDAGLQIEQALFKLEGLILPFEPLGDFLNRNAPQNPPQQIPAADRDDEDSLMAALIQVRQRAATKEAIPAFMLISNQKIKSLIRQKPGTIDELLGLGIHKRAVDLIGNEIIEALNQ